MVVFEAELEEPHTELLCSSPPFFTHLMFCAMWHNPWSWGHGEAQQMQLRVQGQPLLWARCPTQGSRAGPGSLRVTNCRMG